LLSKKNLPPKITETAGRIEMPGGPDCGPRAVCWTLLGYIVLFYITAVPPA